MIVGAAIVGQPVLDGDTILVVLATANSDHLVGQDNSWSFGYGPHAYPGRMIALTIAEAAISGLLQRRTIPFKLPTPQSYPPSANARIPILDCPIQRPARKERQ